MNDLDKVLEFVTEKEVYNNGLGRVITDIQTAKDCFSLAYAYKTVRVFIEEMKKQSATTADSK